MNHAMVGESWWGWLNSRPTNFAEQSNFGVFQLFKVVKVSAKKGGTTVY